jgi:hypothetical protein
MADGVHQPLRRLPHDGNCAGRKGLGSELALPVSHATSFRFCFYLGESKDRSGSSPPRGEFSETGRPTLSQCLFLWLLVEIARCSDARTDR